MYAMSNRKHKRHKHLEQVRAARRYLDGAKGLRLSPTEALRRVQHLRAYRAEYESNGSDLPF
jgi:hypothetical protein